MAQLGTFRYKGKRTLIPHISESFVRTCFVHPDMIAMVEEYQPEDGHIWHQGHFGHYKWMMCAKVKIL
ncbi:hypothetical protein Lal_00042617 [Lupinus albus]|nr:hypothetical protein Lal_00042617 [Lupinus albus]